MKCDNCDRKGMCEHAAVALNNKGDIININKNGRDVEAKMEIGEYDILLNVEGDIFIITKSDME